MGMPFPIGLKFIKNYAPEAIPWAWAINGCASVVSAITASIVAMYFGFTWVVLLSLLCYTLSVLFMKIQNAALIYRS